MSLTPEQVIKRAEAAKADKAIFDTEISEVYDYVMPGRNAYFNKANGSRNDEQLFDDTAPNALKEFAGLLQSSLVRPYTNWASLSPGTEVKEEQHDEVNKALAPINTSMMKAIHHSNFDSQILEMFFDLGIGTGALLVTDGGSIDDPIKFEAIPLNEVYPELGAFGDIDTCFRMYSVIGRNIMQRWPDGKLNTVLKERIENNPGGKIELIEGVIFEPATKKTKKKYRYYVIAVGEKHEIISLDMKTSPWVIPRWDTRPGETLGRGPAWHLLPTIRMLNELSRMTMQNVEQSVNNMWLMNDDAMLDPGGINFEPNSIISAQWEGGNLPIQALQGNANFNIGELKIGQMQEKIERAFYVGQLGSITDSTKSATEISIRNQIRLQQMGSQFGRLQTEFINKLIGRVYDLLSNRNIVPKGLDIDGKVVAIKVEGALAKAQLQEDGQNFITFLTMVGQLAPNLLAVLVDEQAIVWLAESMGVPAGKMPTSDEIKSKLKAMAEMQQPPQMEGAA